MNSRLKYLFNKLEADRIYIMNEVSNLAPEQFQKSVGGKWSIQQIITHVWTAERLSLQYMQKKVQGISHAENTGLMEELKMVALILSQRLPFKFKAPKGLNENTPANLSLDQIKLLWANYRLELKTFLEHIEDDQLKRKIYRQPRAGLLNVQQALVFFREHYIHHLPQIKKIMRSN
jgi:uncharacterized damage-inducible protein DinB